MVHSSSALWGKFSTCHFGTSSKLVPNKLCGQQAVVAEEADHGAAGPQADPVAGAEHDRAGHRAVVDQRSFLAAVVKHVGPAVVQDLAVLAGDAGVPEIGRAHV